MLALTPNPLERGRALELGSPPFHITLLLQRFRNYDLSLTGYTTDGRATIEQDVDSPEFGEHNHFVCQCFDAERDRFPYDDASFDVVTWCEVIEHLTENPVHALGEIHRVLKPGGHLVLSTPNACRADSIMNFLRGRNIYDPYHLGAPLKGSRHSREYTLWELTDLLSGCGYEIERAVDIDIYEPKNAYRRSLRWLLNNVVSRFNDGHYRYHLFVRARKTEQPFRWRFPEHLYDAGHLSFHIAPNSNRIVVGENDAIHASMGWEPTSMGPGGRLARHTNEVGDMYLAPQPDAKRVTVTVSGGVGEVQAWNDRPELVMVGGRGFEAPAGKWTEISFDLVTPPLADQWLHIRFAAPGGVDVAEIRAE